MKKKHLLGFLFMAMVIGVGFVSCERDDGSEGIEFRMRNGSNASAGPELSLLYVDSIYYGDSYWGSTGVRLGINVSSNFYAYPLRNYDYQHCGISNITCVGSVSNLGKINRIPESGWANEVSVKPGNGYIICHKNLDGYSKFCRYARVYVEDWIESTDGGIIGAVIRYQDNWKIEE